MEVTLKRFTPREPTEVSGMMMKGYFMYLREDGMMQRIREDIFLQTHKKVASERKDSGADYIRSGDVWAVESHPDINEDEVLLMMETEGEAHALKRYDFELMYQPEQ